MYDIYIYMRDIMLTQTYNVNTIYVISTHVYIYMCDIYIYIYEGHHVDTHTSHIISKQCVCNVNHRVYIVII